MKASGSAEVRQFATKVDAGTPVNLPHYDMASSFIRHYNNAIERMPILPKGIV